MDGILFNNYFKLKSVTNSKSRLGIFLNNNLLDF